MANYVGNVPVDESMVSFSTRSSERFSGNIDIDVLFAFRDAERVTNSLEFDNQSIQACVRDADKVTNIIDFDSQSVESGIRDAERFSITQGFNFVLSDNSADRSAERTTSNIPGDNWLSYAAGMRKAERKGASWNLIFTTTYYVMSGLDVDAQTVTYRTWVVQDVPDLTGALYTGQKSGSSPLAQIAVKHVWTAAKSGT